MDIYPVNPVNPWDRLNEEYLTKQTVTDFMMKCRSGTTQWTHAGIASLLVHDNTDF